MSDWLKLWFGLFVGRWVPVDRKLPDDGQYVLVDPPYLSFAWDDEPRHVLFFSRSDMCFKYYLGGSVHHAYSLTDKHGWKFRAWMALGRSNKQDYFND